MKAYFNNVQTLDELRKQYRDLLKKYHPDNDGSGEETKVINVEYERLFPSTINSQCALHLFYFMKVAFPLAGKQLRGNITSVTDYNAYRAHIPDSRSRLCFLYIPAYLYPSFYLHPGMSHNEISLYSY